MEYISYRLQFDGFTSSIGLVTGGNRERKAIHVLLWSQFRADGFNIRIQNSVGTVTS